MVGKIVNKKALSKYTGQKSWGSYPPYYRNRIPKRRPHSQFTRPRGEEFTVAGMTGLPDVHISHKANAKMWALMQNCPIEVSWLASVIRNDDGNFEILDVYVPHQECSAASTDISKDGNALMLQELIAQNKVSEINRLRCWGHSHVEMDVGPSLTDEDQTQDFLDSPAINDFFIRLIGNKYGDLQCHVYMLEQGFVLNNPNLKIITSNEDEEDYDEWAIAQIKEKVEEYTYTPASLDKFDDYHLYEYYTNRYGMTGGGGPYHGRYQDDQLDDDFIDDILDLEGYEVVDRDDNMYYSPSQRLKLLHQQEEE